MMKIAIGRPATATFVFAVLMTMACASVTFAWLDLASAETELQGKTERLQRRRQGEEKTGVDGVGAGAPPLAMVADSETLAAAEFDAEIRRMAREAGAFVLSSRAEAKREEKGASDQIEINASVEGTNDVLQETLFGIENGAPLLLVESLTIQPVETEAGASASEPRLHADLTMRGYWNGRRK